MNEQTEIKPRKCHRCGGSGEYIVGPIINGHGRSLGVCFRCRGQFGGFDPVQNAAVRAAFPQFNFRGRNS